MVITIIYIYFLFLFMTCRAQVRMLKISLFTPNKTLFHNRTYRLVALWFITGVLFAKLKPRISCNSEIKGNIIIPN